MVNQNMPETPQHHMAGKDVGCGFMGSFFGPRHRKPSPVPRLEASKEHQKTQPPSTNTFHKPPQKQKHQKPVAKHPHTHKPPSKPVVKKPVNSSYNSLYTSALYNNASQVTNISYTKQLRKEPSFTSSELSLRVTSTIKIPSHLGNLQKKKKLENTAKSNNYSNLGNIYGNAVKKPGHESFKKMGNEKYKEGRFDEAIALYTEAIGMDSSVACYYSNRSAALIGQGKLVDAILDCRIAIRIDPSYHRAHNRLGSLYLRFGEAEKALCHYKCSGEKAARQDIAKVQAVKAQFFTCSEARKLKDWKKLLKESQFAYSLGADSSLQVFAMQAEALLNLHKHEEAYSGFQNAPVVDVNISAQLFGTTVATYFLTVQAQVYLASGRFEEAVSVALRASEVDPSEEVFSAARKIRALAKARANGNKLFKASQFSEACNLYSEGLDHEPYNSVLLCNRAACRYKLGQFERAVEDCTIALNLRPSYGKARLRRAQCNAKLERWEAAIQDYDILNHDMLEDKEVERQVLEARTQLKRQHVADAKPVVRFIDGPNKEEFGGFLIAV